MENVQTSVPHEVAPLKKCGHAGCTCTVAPDEQYCSDYCATAAHAGKQATGTDCQCGHPECAASAGAEAT
jgi:hypothetical protein